MATLHTCIIVDDEDAICRTLAYHLRDNNYKPIICHSGEEALVELQKNDVDVVISDVRMTGMSGLDLLKKIKEQYEFLPVIMITAYGNVEMAVNATKLGAFDFIEKPFQIDKLFVILHNAIQANSLQKENVLLKSQLQNNRKVTDLFIGDSPPIKKLKEMIADVAATDSTVLITGESGTGKEVVTRQIYQQSQRVDKPFHALNCTAIPHNLIESELFGYVKGAFTGATENKKGIIELVKGGTLFLDEIGDLPLESQGKLLRLLENKEFYRLGSTRRMSADFRLIASTNKNLQDMINKNSFREDLFYRLSVVELQVPPLRSRTEDIPLLADFFINQFAREMKKEAPQLSPDALDILMHYSYPGNVRELRNILERQIIFSKTPCIKVNGLHYLYHRGNGSKDTLYAGDSPPELKEIEKRYILERLAANENNKEKTAIELGISRKTLWAKLKKYAGNTNRDD